MKRLMVLSMAVVCCVVFMGANAHAQTQYLLDFSKLIRSDQIVTTCMDITCDPNQQVVMYTLQVNAMIDSITTCDETAAMIPNGSRFFAYIKKVIRLDAFPGPAGEPIGYIQFGKFWILDPAGNLLMIGQMFGTEGFETHGSCGLPECDAFPHMEGHLKGFGVDGGPLDGWRLEVSYSGSQQAELDLDSCHWFTMNMQTDGILYKTCP